MPTWSSMTDLDTGDLVTAADMDAIRGNIEYLLDPNSDLVEYNNGSTYTTTSTSFVDVDATNLKVTITTNGGPVLVVFAGSGSVSLTYGLGFDIDVDGTRLASSNTFGLVRLFNQSNVVPVAFAVLVDGLSAGSHTFKLQWRVSSGGTGNLNSDTSTTPATLQAIEL